MLKMGILHLFVGLVLGAASILAAPLPLLAEEALIKISKIPREASSHPAFSSLKMIVIDPGHGGVNEGAIGIAGIYEKHLTLSLAMHFADLLQAQHPELKVRILRQRDVALGLVERIEIANKLEADLFISLHFNSARNPNASGFESFRVASGAPLLPSGNESHLLFLEGLSKLPERASKRSSSCSLAGEFTRAFHVAMEHHIGTPDRGSKRANYTVLEHAKVPAVVLEFGFLSNEGEAHRLRRPHFHRRMAEALIQALEQYDREQGVFPNER